MLHICAAAGRDVAAEGPTDGHDWAVRAAQWPDWEAGSHLVSPGRVAD